MESKDIILEINKIITNKLGSKFCIKDKDIEINFRDLDLDSLKLLDLITTIEQKLNITLPDEELIKLKNVKELIELIKKILNK